jgi:hypothetical protein
MLPICHGGASSTGIRIFIHYAGSDVASAALAHRLAGYLRGQGFAVADIGTVDFRIAKPSVRYFFGADRNDSEHLVEAVERFLDHAQSRSPRQLPKTGRKSTTRTRHSCWSRSSHPMLP